jgi:hypothetical protein
MPVILYQFYQYKNSARLYLASFHHNAKYQRIIELNVL